MDAYVKKVQEWLNATYSDNDDFSVINADGITGNATCTALVKAMQIELGVTPVDGVWGSGTSNAFASLSTDTDASNTSLRNRIYILQGGLYCKGYNPGGFTGTFGNGTATAVKKFESDAGLSNPSGIATATVMKALLNTDAYTLLSTGDSMIRTMQQSLNNQYYQYTGLIPCDGIYTRVTCSALITGLQVEQRKEHSDTVVDGLWGPTTMSRCPTLSMYTSVSNKQYVYLLQYALYANGYDPNGFDGGFGNGVRTAVISFQAFSGLDADGIVGRQTWASLLVSYGDANRTCTAIDCMTPITEDTAALLAANGRTAVGRYLTGDSTKALTIDELRIIHNAGLRLFPIYQTSGNEADYFSRRKGLVDAYKAYKAYGDLRIPDGAIVYFAVDYDASASDITNNIIPYFKAINERLNKLGNSRFGVGVYAPRYVCTRLREEGLTISSFVCDMSSGFSCNIGYKLPEDWAFDQIRTTTLSNGTASLEVDNDFTSERDSSILADPDNYNGASSPTLAEYNVIAAVCRHHGIDTDILNLDFEYGAEYPVLILPFAEIYAVISHSATAPDADFKLSIPVSNGVISTPSFISVLENITSEIPIIPSCIDYEGLALAIDYGVIQLEISATTTVSGLPAMAIEITTVATQSKTNQLEMVLSVGIKYVFATSVSDYRTYLQAAEVFSAAQIEEACNAYEKAIEYDTVADGRPVISADSSESTGYIALSALPTVLYMTLASCGVTMLIKKYNLEEVFSSLGLLTTVASQYFSK